MLNAYFVCLSSLLFAYLCPNNEVSLLIFVSCVRGGVDFLLVVFLSFFIGALLLLAGTC